MSHAPLFTQALIDCREKILVGGKAANLGRLLRAGFAVPGGFVVTTQAYRFAQQSGSNGNGDGRVPAHLPEEIAQEICRAYRALGEGSVAVRSSATAEDMAAASMAGQYETFLDIVGEVALVDAIYRCWASLDSPRIQTYLNEYGIDPARVAMAVVVQRLVPAAVAGVLFTANPHNGSAREMLVEASWGLGESVVSGRVQPDVLRLEHETGKVLAATIADKRVHLAPGRHEEQQVEEDRRRVPCLRGRDVHRLWQMGRHIAEHFGSPQDVEWAIHDGELFVLQSRPITTLEEAEAYEQVLRTTRQRLREQHAAGRGPWALHNLAETLAHPTPLTWSIISHFMSGQGGFGAMYRQVGFEPSATVNRDGFLELIAGRIYMDAARAPEMFFENFPFAYDLKELKRSPDAAQSPPTVPTSTFMARMKAGGHLGRVNQELRRISVDLDRNLNGEIFPALTGWRHEEKKCDLSGFTVESLIDLWRQRETKVLDEFAPQSLMPSLICGMAMSDLRTFLATHFWRDDPDELSQFISSGGPINRTIVADAQLHEVGQGVRSLDQWLADHGHRAAGEFDLTARRWREEPQAVREMASRLASGEGPLERHRRHSTEVLQRIDQLRARLRPRDRDELECKIGLLWRYIFFREDSKDFLMLGYDLLRDIALEAGRRLEIGEEVFFLTREDLFDALRVGFAPHHLIEQRIKAHRAEEKMPVPRVIDHSTIDALGNPPELKTAGGYKAFAVSSGIASGPARIRKSPTEVGEIGTGYILVCPSTDPSWTPLFVNAAGLVLECGGTLSHGAVVAREMGLPAVVLPDATRLFAEGEEIRVDGRTGLVTRVLEESATPLPQTVDPSDTHIAFDKLPPPPGPKDILAARLRNIFGLVWIIYLAGAFLLPERWIYQPTLSFLDLFLWPISRGPNGKPLVVAVVSGGLAILTLFLQKWMTDNARLLEAKRRAAALNAESQNFPKDSPRRSALVAAAATVQWRTLAAAMAPIGLILGPMVMTFTWFTERVDPASWNAAPGSAVQIVATVDGDATAPITLSIPAPFFVDGSTPAQRSLPDYRQTLTRLLMLYRKPLATTQAWELQLAPDPVRERRMAIANDLETQLKGHLKPRGVTWKVIAPENLEGRYTASVSVPQHAPAAVDVVLGEKLPPAPPTVQGRKDSPIHEVKVVYPPPRQKPVFWEPFRLLGTSRLGAISVGWLVLYIIAYLPTLFILRWLLKIA